MVKLETLLFWNIYMNPLLLDLPIPITTTRLLLRPPQAGDGKKLNQVVTESFEQLHQWMKWAAHKPTADETEIYVRQAQAEWILRKDLNLLIFDRNETTIIGACGFNEIDWNIPSLAIGYWVRTTMQGKDYATEAAYALAQYAFKELNAARVEIRCDTENMRSKKVAEKIGFTLEGILKNHRKMHGSLSNTALYACYSADSLKHT
jgi:RimJ/RimL family protein N-acetyltransferase